MDNNLGKEFKLFARDYVSYSEMDRFESSIIKSSTPHIVEERPGNVAIMSVFDRLMQDRIIFLGGGIGDQISNIIVAQLLFLSNVDSKRDITMYINSGGGSVSSGLSIYDTMNLINPDVATINVGICASMAAVLLCSGAKGKRSSLKNARTMIHQPLGGLEGKSSEMEIYMEEMKKIRTSLYEIISEQSGKEYNQVFEDCVNDKWMNSGEAKDYGLIDEVISKK